MCSKYHFDIFDRGCRNVQYYFIPFSVLDQVYFYWNTSAFVYTMITSVFKVCLKYSLVVATSKADMLCG
jgi:hypothetical protein